MGPLERGKLGTISPRGRAQDARVFFARPRLANLEGRSPEGAFAGWPSLCLGHSRGSRSGRPQGGTKRFITTPSD